MKSGQTKTSFPRSIDNDPITKIRLKRTAARKCSNPVSCSREGNLRISRRDQIAAFDVRVRFTSPFDFVASQEKGDIALYTPPRP